MMSIYETFASNEFKLLASPTREIRLNNKQSTTHRNTQIMQKINSQWEKADKKVEAKPCKQGVTQEF